MDNSNNSNPGRVLVAHNVARHGCGGMARMLESIHTALEAFGWEIDYFTADNMPAKGCPRIQRYAFSWYARHHARNAFLQGKAYDIINIHEPSGTAVVFGKSLIGKPAVVAISHGLEQRYWEQRLSRQTSMSDVPGWRARIFFPITSLWQSRLTLRHADHILCVNEEDRSYLVHHLHCDAERITRVFPGAGPEFARVAARRYYDSSCNRILFSGTWIARKGIHQIVEAFVALAARHPSIQLGILGAGVSLARVLSDFPESLHPRIIVFPALSHADCAEVLLDCDIFILPSLFEGTPLSLIEAMSTGIPVITSAICGMKDVVEDGVNGLLVAPGDSKQIVSSVELVMADSNLRERLGRRAAHDATYKYTWRAAAELVNEVYSGLTVRRTCGACHA